MSRIEALSADQWAAVARERERWVAIGSCTDPADRETTEEVITGFYRRIGKDRPAFVWGSGPLASCLEATLVASLSKRGKLRDQLWEQLGEQLRDQLWDQLWGQLRGPLRGQLGGQLWGQLWDQLWGQLGGQLWGQLGGQLWGQLWDQLWGQLGGQLGGQARRELDNGWHLAQPGFWIGHYAACRDVAGAEYASKDDELLRQWERLAAASGWWFPYEGVCFCAERHERVRFDAERRLHCEDGPAILCRDGFAVHAWHGTRVPADWIEQTADVDPKLALTWENIEQRRCLAEIVGWDKVLDQLSPVVVDEDSPEVGKLLRVDLPDAPGEQFLQVRCGTGRTFVLPVPPEMTTARQANAWTYGLNPEEWSPEIRT